MFVFEDGENRFVLWHWCQVLSGVDNTAPHSLLVDEMHVATSKAASHNTA